ncbi:hypothetical protein FQA39_LY03276 [Lamprigera yunnana]|nr:hypothetical protein FQA39_LY03276 [Lamprigera yunnana]
MLMVPDMSVEMIIGMIILNQYKMVIDFDKKCVKCSNYEEYFVEENKEEEEPERNMNKEININNVNIRRDAENDNPIGENGKKEEMSGNINTKYGYESESNAKIDKLQSVKKCGLFIDIANSFLAVNLDGLVNDDEIIEV